MLTPLAVGSRVDAGRYRRWLNKFGTYWSNPNRAAVDEWLSQFSEADQDLAARLLDGVLFFDQAAIYQRFRSLLAALEGWNDDPTLRTGRWVFVPFTGSPGESGDTMTHWFRSATGMTQRKYNELFCYRSELVSKAFGPDDTVVLIDDFAGTGNQAVTAWNEYFSELVAGGPRVVLMLLCATADAAERIASTDMNLHSGQLLQRSDNFFSDSCLVFSPEEKTRVLTYCKKAKRSEAKGHGESGLLVVFSFKCPNNSIPVMHARSGKWEPLFPRRGDE